jgi:alpha-tubulin suppressor-like RCC1 family protein
LPVSVSAGLFSTCVLDENGNVYGTGANAYGELGAVTVGTQLYSPVAVQGLGDEQNVLMVTNGLDTCTVRKDTTMVCIGWDNAGQLGRGSISGESSIPAPVIGVGWKKGDVSPLHDVVAIALGGDDGTSASSACAIVRPECAPAGQIYCWGGNYYGELGDGTTEAAPGPVPVLAPR